MLNECRMKAVWSPRQLPDTADADPEKLLKDEERVSGVEQHIHFRHEANAVQH